jgi:hypothetical protein
LNISQDFAIGNGQSQLHFGSKSQIISIKKVKGLKMLEVEKQNEVQSSTM